MKFLKKQKIKRDTKRVFFKKGTCSRTFFYLLNREFGHPMDMEEQAADPLAGGVFQQGYQCGMLWGSALALGAESFRRTEKLEEATALAISSAKHITESFKERAGSIDCQEITETDWSKKFSILKYFATGKMFKCFGLADKWAPEVFEEAAKGLSPDQSVIPTKAVSCASLTVKKMGGSDSEAATVAGLAGGIGLFGGGCGALGAAVWKSTLERVKKGKYKYTLSDPLSERMMNDFYKETDYKMECSEITGRKFKTVEDHTVFIDSGGCKGLIDTIARSAGKLG